MRDARRTLLGSMVMTLLIAWGCGGAPSVDTTTAEAKVVGKVTLRGKAVTKGTVSFDPGNAQRAVPARSAEIKPDGTYEITTLIGMNGVNVNGPQIAADAKLGYQSTNYDVKKGENTFNIELPLSTR